MAGPPLADGAVVVPPSEEHPLSPKHPASPPGAPGPGTAAHGSGSSWAEPRRAPSQPAVGVRRSAGSGDNSGGGSAAGGVSLPSIAPEGVLSARRAEKAAAADAAASRQPHSARARLGGGSAQEAALRPRVRTSRERNFDNQQRSRSVDARRQQSAEPTRPSNSAEGQVAKEGRGKPPAGAAKQRAGHEAFLRLLLDGLDAGARAGVDPATLARLEVGAGPSRQLQDIVQTLKVLARMLQPDNSDGSIQVAQPQEADQSPETEQLAAQVAYLEKKMVRLREKLKRKTREFTQAAESLQASASASTIRTDFNTASIEELLAETTHLRAERDRLENQRLRPHAQTASARAPGLAACEPGRFSLAPGGGHGGGHVGAQIARGGQKSELPQLSRQLSYLQAQMAELMGEKAIADSNAETARTIAEKVERHLREAVLGRESERIELETEREVLRLRIEEQDAALRRMSTMEISEGKIEQLRTKVAEAECELAPLRRNRASKLSDSGSRPTSVFQAGERASIIRPGLSYSEAFPHFKPPVMQDQPDAAGGGAAAGGADVAYAAGGADVAHAAGASVPRSSTASREAASPRAMEEDAELLLHARDEAVRGAAELRQQLEAARAAGEVEARRLDQELAAVRNELQRAELRRRRELANEVEKRRSDLDYEATSQLEAKQGQDSKALDAALEHNEKLDSQGKAALAAERGQARQRLRLLESRLDSVQQELVRTQEHHRVAVKRHRALRGRFYLGIRNGRAYQRHEVMHYLSCALNVKVDDLRVVEEVLVPQGTSARELARTKGMRAPVPEATLDNYVRPLRDFGADPSGGGGDYGDGGEGASAQVASADEEAAEPPPQDPDEAATRATEVAMQAANEAGEAAKEGREEERACETSGPMLRLAVEVVTPEGAAGHAEAARIVDRLTELVRHGGSVLEDVRVASVCSFRGSATFDDEDAACVGGGYPAVADLGGGNAAWRDESAEVIGRASHLISERQLIISAYRQREPHAVKLVALDNARNEEWILCFNTTDLSELLGASSPLCRDARFGEELVDVLVGMLHVVEGAGGRPFLVALHAVPAPRTELNALPGLGDRLEAAANVLPVDVVQLRAEEETSATLAEEMNLAMQLSNADAEVTSRPQPMFPGERIVFEDLLIIEERFFVLAVCEDAAAGTLRVEIQESGICQDFQVVLPGRAEGSSGRPARQLRVSAQACEFGELTLLVAVEEILVPPALVIRLARGSAVQPLAFRDPEQKVYWLSRLQWKEDGGLCRLLDGCSGLEAVDEAPALVSEVPSRHHERLLKGVRDVLRGSHAATKQSEAAPALGISPWLPEYGNDASKSGVVLRDATAQAPARRAAAGLVAKSLLKASAQAAGRPLLKMDQEVPGPALQGVFHLCEVTAHEIAEPYQHFIVTAQEIEATAFEVTLTRPGLEVSFGFEIEPDRDGKPVVVTANIVSGGLLDQWNNLGENSCVLAGAELFTVNGAQAHVDISAELRVSTSVTMTVRNPPQGHAWELLVDSLEIFRKLHERVAACPKDPAARRALARRLVEACELEEDPEAVALGKEAGQRLRLILVKADDDQDETLAVAVVDKGQGDQRIHHQSFTTPSVHALLAPQVLLQDGAAQYINDVNRFCVLRAERPLGEQGNIGELWIFDEPDAPDSACLINNLLIIVCVQGVYFSTRLHDNVLQHSLVQDEMYLLDPHHRRDLLVKVFNSMDISKTTSPQGLCERLVMQPFLTTKAQRFQTDSTGTLRAVTDAEVNLGCSKALALTAGGGGEEGSEGMLALSDAAEMQGAAAGGAGPEAARAAPLALVDVYEAKPGLAPRAVQIGGRNIARADAEGSSSIGEASPAFSPPVIPSRVQLAQRRAQFADHRVDLTLYKDSQAHVFVLRQLDSDDALTGCELEVQIPAHAEHLRIYLEHRTFDGDPVIVAMEQQPFPHEVRAVLYDPRSSEEVQIAARDDMIMPFTERSVRERLSDALDKLAKEGALDVAGNPPQFRNVSIGREIFPSVFTSRALQQHVPVVTVNFAQLCHDVPGKEVISRELLFSCSRYVVSPRLLAGIAAASASGAAVVEGALPPGVDLETTPLLRLSLTKKSYCGDFTFSIENAHGDSADTHMLHIRDKLSINPLGLYGEIQKVGDLRLIVAFLDDGLPRALRILVAEPSSGWAFQLIVIDSAPPPLESVPQMHRRHWRLLLKTKVLAETQQQEGLQKQPLAYLAASPQRRELLQFFRRRFSVSQQNRGAPAPKNAPLALQDRFGTTLSLQAPLPMPPSPQAASLPGTLSVPPKREVITLARETRLLEEDVVLVTASCEFTDDGAFLMKATASQPFTSQEQLRILVNPGLDRLLHACGLPSAADISVESLGDESSRTALAAIFLRAVEVQEEPLDVIFQLEAVLAQEDFHAVEDGGGPALLECDEERLLGRVERAYTNAVESAHDASLRVEVFDGSDCREALFHSTNLRLRLSDLETERVVTRDVHEEDLEPWLSKVDAAHLCCASREPELVELVLRYATLAEPGSVEALAGKHIVLGDISDQEHIRGRFAVDLMDPA